nr:hypothetical protein BgiMline_005742 [Biomphalaria glabrata]
MVAGAGCRYQVILTYLELYYESSCPAKHRCTNTTNTNIGTTNFTITSTEASIITNTTAHQALTPLAQTSTAPAPIPPAASTPQQTAAPKYKYQHQNPTIISTTSPSIITTANSNTFRKTPLAISLPASPPPPSPEPSLPATSLPAPLAQATPLPETTLTATSLSATSSPKTPLAEIPSSSSSLNFIWVRA